ncbi:MAG: hypothetical protein K8R69_07800 [Deltaproteobacteria bacterium]|nr:hypothetical protein [Deltaproteobacteria bacterium]
MQRRLQAAQVFSQLGLKERVKESLAPLQAYAKQLSDPKKMAGLSFNLAQLYQGAGMTSEANAALQAIVDLGGPSAAPEYRELGTLARGVQQLNRGEVKEARETFAGIPQNPVAQTFLVSLQEGARKNRFAMAVGVLRSVSLNFLERGKESTFGGFSKEEYESLSRDTLGAWDEVQKLLIGGDAANIDEAIADVQASGRFPGFRTGFSTNYGVDPHEKDTSEFHVASSVRDFLAALDNPATGDLDLAKSALELGSRLEADGYYSAAGGIYSFMGKDPLVQADAKARLDSLPASIKVRTGIGIAWNVISFAAGPAGIIGANSTSSAGGGDYVENVAMALVPFGIARAFAVGAEAIYVAKTASLIRNPMLFKAGGFLVGKTAEAAGFTLGNMAMLSLLKGRSDQWTWGHFGKEFGTMLVTFMLLHGAGAALQGLGRSSKGAVARAEADLARALESGSGVSSAVSRLRLARGVESVSTSGITAWGVRVSAFTGSDYFNEAIGLKDPEPGIPFGVRLFSSAVMDAQMIVAGKSIDALSGGRLGKLEKATQEKYFEHQVGYETERLLPLVEGLGLDAKSPAGRQVLQGLLTARLNGESLVDLQGRTSPEERAAYEKAVSEHWGLDPKSAEGQQALAQLLGYGQSHPFAAGGRPLSAAEVVELTGKLDAEGSRLLLAAGIERGPHFESLRRGLLGFALQTGMEVSQLGVYAKQATALKAPLRGLAEQLLGQDGAKTPEGQNLMGELAVYAMLRASAPEKLAETLEGLGNKEWGADVRAELRGRAEALFGKGGEETPSGREWMTRLFLRGLYGSEQPSEILPALQAGVEAGRELASLADVASLARPKERLALAIWALERGVDAEVLKGTTTMVLKGQIEFRVEQGRIRVFEVPKEQQAAKASEVRDRLPELPSELLREDRAATARAGEEILPVTEDMIVSDEPKVADSDATKPGKKIKPIETTVAGKRKTVEALAARKGMTSKPSAEVPIVLDAKEGMTVLPRVEGPIPDVELRVGEERLKLSFEAGDVIPLEEKAGKLNFGAEVKEAKGEIAVLRNEHGELAFYFRTVGEAKGQELQPGDKLRVGDVEFLWEGPQNRPKPELKSVPLEPTKNEGLPKADKPPTLQGKIGLSETEISAHAFLDFYFGEEGSIKTLDAFVARSQGSERNSWVDAAVDFRRTLGSFQTKVAEYDALEKDFDLHRANFLDAKGKDPEKAKESAHLAEEALKARGELELEIARDLKALTKEPYNQLELQYNARVSKAEKEAIPLDFALAAAEVEAAIASRGTDEKQALHYQLVFTPLGEISENHYDYEFNRLPLGELAHAEVHVTRWEVAERTLQQMVDEGVLKPEQLPDFEALRAGGAKEFEVSAEIPGSGKMRVVFHFEGKVEEPSGATPSEGGKSGGLGLTGALLGLTTLLTPEIARASDGAAGGGDASLLPWVLGVGAALLTAAGGAYLWAKARPESKTSEQDGDALRKRRSSAADKISESKPLTQGPVKIPTGKGVGGDLLSFLGDRPSLVDRAPVPGIDRKEMRRLESIFEKGGDLMEMELPDGSKLTRLVELVTGAATMNAMPVGEEVVQFFKQWKKENGFRPVDALTARRAWKELNQRAKKAGIQIEFGGPTVKGRAIDPKELQEKIDYQGAPIAYLNELMKLLPDSMLNNPRLKHLYLDTGRQGAGELSWPSAVRAVISRRCFSMKSGTPRPSDINRERRVIRRFRAGFETRWPSRLKFFLAKKRCSAWTGPWARRIGRPIKPGPSPSFSPS